MWGYDFTIDSRTVDIPIRRLREKHDRFFELTELTLLGGQGNLSLFFQFRPVRSQGR